MEEVGFLEHRNGRIADGDSVITTTVDAGGHDYTGERVTPGAATQPATSTPGWSIGTRR